VTWPGRDADDWWDSLTVERKEQLHRWVTQRKPANDLPEEQLALDVSARNGR
jgi:hypothetical protein